MLSWLRRTPSPLPQLARWLTFIEEFDYDVVLRNGKKHSNADGLSRMALILTGNQPEVFDESTDSDTGSEAHIRIITAKESEEPTSVREKNAAGQLADPEFGESPSPTRVSNTSRTRTANKCFGRS